LNKIHAIAALAVALLAFSYGCVIHVTPGSVWAASDYWFAWCSALSGIAGILAGVVAFMGYMTDGFE